jgi:hypothetical protein
MDKNIINNKNQVIKLLDKFVGGSRGFGFIPMIAKEMNIPKGKGWLIELKEPLNKLGYKIIEDTESSSGLPDSTEYWWNYSEPQKYKVVKL